MGILSIGSNDGLMSMCKDGYGNIKPLSAYICRADRKIVCRINGITQFNVSAKFNDLSEISFEVQRYVINPSTFVSEENIAYNYLSSLSVIYITELGKFGYFRIDAEPKITLEGTQKETKAFTARSYETTMQYEFLRNFVINMGTTESIEMASDNLDALGSPKKKVCLYNPDDTGYSLLNLVLSDDKFGWTIGYVDSSIKALQRSFDVDSTNLYAFLRSDVSAAFRCIFVFDTVNLTINAYDIETVGNDTNIYMSLYNFMQTLDISPTKDEITTVFQVKGKDDLGIDAVNFGSNKIMNVDYPISFCSEDLQTRYAAYVTYRESQRSSYAELTKTYSNLLQQKSSIEDRSPSDDVEKNWSSTVYYSLSDLQTDLAAYQAAVDAIAALFTID